MSKGKLISKMLGISVLAMMFGTGAAYAQATTEKEALATSKSAAGKTDPNRRGQMSPVGENATTSVYGKTAPAANKAADKKEASSGASAGMSSGAAGAGTAAAGAGTAGAMSSGASGEKDALATSKNAAGKTDPNRRGQMSPVGENATTSAYGKTAPAANKAADKSGTGAAAAGTGAAGAGMTNKSMSSGSSANMSSGASAGKDKDSMATSKDAAGKTDPNRRGNMSPTGENATTSVYGKTAPAATK